MNTVTQIFNYLYETRQFTLVDSAERRFAQAVKEDGTEMAKEWVDMLLRNAFNTGAKCPTSTQNVELPEWAFWANLAHTVMLQGFWPDYIVQDVVNGLPVVPGVPEVQV
jgi:hypothetical protein